jgi:signal peptidase II
MSALTAQRIGFAIAAAALALDQISKNLLLYGYDFIHLGRAARIPVLPFFDLVMVWNRGISYGLLPAEGALGTTLLILFQLIAAAALSFWLLYANRRFLALGLGLLIGGALGNVIDRMRFGAVADFFHFYAMGRDWYVFNMADAAITVGVVALLTDAFFRPTAQVKSIRE